MERENKDVFEELLKVIARRQYDPHPAPVSSHSPTVITFTDEEVAAPSTARADASAGVASSVDLLETGMIIEEDCDCDDLNCVAGQVAVPAPPLQVSCGLCVLI